jgi:hypothetical protein
MSTLRHLDAILTIADRELARDDWHDRGGAFRALLDQAMPYLRQLRDREHALDVLRRELAIAESNASERSDPASNAENDDEIRRLRAVIEQHEVQA